MTLKSTILDSILGSVNVPALLPGRRERCTVAMPLGNVIQSPKKVPAKPEIRAFGSKTFSAINRER